MIQVSDTPNPLSLLSEISRQRMSRTVDPLDKVITLYEISERFIVDLFRARLPRTAEYMQDVPEVVDLLRGLDENVRVYLRFYKCIPHRDNEAITYKSLSPQEVADFIEEEAILCPDLAEVRELYKELYADTWHETYAGSRDERHFIDIKEGALLYPVDPREVPHLVAKIAYTIPKLEIK